MRRRIALARVVVAATRSPRAGASDGAVEPSPRPEPQPSDSRTDVASSTPGNSSTGSSIAKTARVAGERPRAGAT